MSLEYPEITHLYCREIQKIALQLMSFSLSEKLSGVENFHQLVLEKLLNGNAWETIYIEVKEVDIDVCFLTQLNRQLAFPEKRAGLINNSELSAKVIAYLSYFGYLYDYNEYKNIYEVYASKISACRKYNIAQFDKLNNDSMPSKKIEPEKKLKKKSDSSSKQALLDSIENFTLIPSIENGRKFLKKYFEFSKSSSLECALNLIKNNFPFKHLYAADNFIEKFIDFFRFVSELRDIRTWSLINLFEQNYSKKNSLFSKIKEKIKEEIASHMRYTHGVTHDHQILKIIYIRDIDSLNLSQKISLIQAMNGFLGPQFLKEKNLPEWKFDAEGLVERYQKLNIQAGEIDEIVSALFLFSWRTPQEIISANFKILLEIYSISSSIQRQNIHIKLKSLLHSNQDNSIKKSALKVLKDIMTSAEKEIFFDVLISDLSRPLNEYLSQSAFDMFSYFVLTNAQKEKLCATLTDIIVGAIKQDSDIKKMAAEVFKSIKFPDDVAAQAIDMLITSAKKAIANDSGDSSDSSDSSDSTDSYRRVDKTLVFDVLSSVDIPASKVQEVFDFLIKCENENRFWGSNVLLSNLRALKQVVIDKDLKKQLQQALENQLDEKIPKIVFLISNQQQSLDPNCFSMAISYFEMAEFFDNFSIRYKMLNNYFYNLFCPAYFKNTHKTKYLERWEDWFSKKLKNYLKRHELVYAVILLESLLVSKYIILAEKEKSIIARVIKDYRLYLVSIKFFLGQDVSQPNFLNSTELPLELIRKVGSFFHNTSDCFLVKKEQKYSCSEGSQEKIDISLDVRLIDDVNLRERIKNIQSELTKELSQLEIDLTVPDQNKLLWEKSNADIQKEIELKKIKIAAMKTLLNREYDGKFSRQLEISNMIREIRNDKRVMKGFPSSRVKKLLDAVENQYCQAENTAQFFDAQHVTTRKYT